MGLRKEFGRRCLGSKNIQSVYKLADEANDRAIVKIGRLKISLAWYDLWIGAYIDVKKKKLHICILPTLLVTIDL